MPITKQQASQLLASTSDGNGIVRIVNALKTLMRHTPYSEIRIVDLCHEAGIARNTFYKHFKNKDNVLEYLMDSLIVSFSVTDDHSGFLHCFEFWYEIREWVKLLIQNDLWDYLSIQNLKKYTPLLRPRNWNKYYGYDSDAQKLTFEFVNAGLNRMLEWWCMNDFRKTPQEMATIAERTLSGLVCESLEMQ